MRFRTQQHERGGASVPQEGAETGRSQANAAKSAGRAPSTRLAKNGTRCERRRCGERCSGADLAQR